MTKIAASQRQQVADMYLAGNSVVEIAASYSVTRPLVSAILKRMGVKLPKLARGPKVATKAHRNLAIAEMYKAGKTQTQVAEEFGLTGARVCVILKSIGVAANVQTKFGPGRPGNWKRSVQREDHATMVEMYKSGQSLNEVGAHYGITRERARQILTGLGVGRMEGGSAIKMFKNVDKKVDAAKAKNERSESRIRKTWGLSLTDYAAHVAEHGSSHDKGSPLRKFTEHRKNARQRGLGWDFTFAEWWRLWQESGKWDQRGRGKHGYVMARWGDGDAPYSVDTVYICTQPENARDGYIVSPGAERAAKARITRARKAQEVQPCLI